jgi:hypothetical protein
MNKLAIILGLCTFCAIAGRESAPKPDEFIIVAYEEGRKSVILQVLDDGTIQEARR